MAMDQAMAQLAAERAAQQAVLQPPINVSVPQRPVAVPKAPSFDLSTLEKHLPARERKSLLA